MLLTDEINVKYHNPFHINFWDENFLKILRKKFSNVKILRTVDLKLIQLRLLL